MTVQTPNYRFEKPLVNDPVDANIWGGLLNNNANLLETYVTALNSANIGNTQPQVPGTSMPTPGMLWLDTSAGSGFYLLKIYGIGGWATIGALNTDLNTFSQNNVSYNITILTSSGTYNTPQGLSFAKVTAIGGGGAGSVGGNPSLGNATSGGGGGAGGVCVRAYTVAQLGASQTFTIGSGGIGNSSPGTSGGNGGTTIFATGSLVLTASGGSGAPGQTSAQSGSNASIGGNGGAASGGTINISGAAGGDGFAYRIGDLNNYMMAGNGASTMFGTGGKGGKILNISGTAQSGGANATGYGAGGGGAGFVSLPSPLTVFSGNGSQGAIIIEEYF